MTVSSQLNFDSQSVWAAVDRTLAADSSGTDDSRRIVNRLGRIETNEFELAILERCPALARGDRCDSQEVFNPQ